MNAPLAKPAIPVSIAPSQAARQAEPADNVNKIRDIIFGAQMRDYDRRFGEMSHRFNADLERLEKDIDLRLQRLESLVRKEFDDTAHKFQQEKRERDEVASSLDAALQEAKKALTARIASLGDELARNTSALRGDMHAQGNTFSQRMNEALASLNTHMASDMGKLRADKVTRHDLGDLLAEVALRLKDDFTLPASR